MAAQAAPWKAGDAYHQMLGTIFDYWACWTISTIAELSIADHLAGGSLTADEVAAREGSGPETTLRLLRAGVSVGLVVEEADGRFTSTPLLETLRSDDPRSLRPLVLSQISGWMPWEHVAGGIKEGSTASTKAFGGMDAFEYMAAHPKQAEQFSGGMTGMTGVWGPAIATQDRHHGRAMCGGRRRWERDTAAAASARQPSAARNRVRPAQHHRTRQSLDHAERSGGAHQHGRR